MSYISLSVSLTILRKGGLQPRGVEWFRGNASPPRLSPSLALSSHFGTNEYFMVMRASELHKTEYPRGFHLLGVKIQIVDLRRCITLSSYLSFATPCVGVCVSVWELLPSCCCSLLCQSRRQNPIKIDLFWSVGTRLGFP